MSPASGVPGGLPAPLPYTFSVDGQVCTVPDTPTRDLLALYAEGNPLLVVPGLVAEGDELSARLMDPADDLDVTDVEHVALQVGEQIAGCGFWPAARLAATAVRHWMMFDGWCLSHGYSPLDGPLSRILAGVLAWRLSMCEKDSEAKSVHSEVFAPVTASVTGRHVAADLTMSDEAEADTWARAFAQFGGG